MNISASINSGVWSFGNILRDDGVVYGDYVEQLTCLLFPGIAEANLEELAEPDLIAHKIIDHVQLNPGNTHA